MLILDGCQSHTTGLLVAYLAMSLHWSTTQNERFYKDQSYDPQSWSSSNVADIKYIYLGTFLVILIILVYFWKRFAPSKKKAINIY